MESELRAVGSFGNSVTVIPSESFQLYRTPVAIPEPASLIVWSVIGVGLFVAARRRRIS